MSREAMVRAVLFDLDDTLFDHRGCARNALEAVRACHDSFGAVPFAELERAHARALEELHGDVMLGRVPIDEARRERFRRLFGVAGVAASEALAELAASTYRQRYLSSRRAVPGAADVLTLVKTRARIGIVSNNLFDEQQDKLQCCGLERFVDELVVSEHAGVSKPDPAIFHIALDRLGCTPGEAVMIGDSWAADIAGARAAGVRALWFNARGETAPEADGAIEELRAFEPAEAVLHMIFDAQRE